MKGNKNENKIISDDIVYIGEDDFRYGKIVFAIATYNMEMFSKMRYLLLNLKEKNYQNKKIALIENGTWSPNSAKCIKNIIETIKNI